MNVNAQSHRRFALAFLSSATLVALLCPTPAWAHLGHADPAPWQACEGKSLGDGCSFVDNLNLHRGTCRELSGSRMCVRNRPLEPKEALWSEGESAQHVLVAQATSIARRPASFTMLFTTACGLLLTLAASSLLFRSRWVRRPGAST